MYQRNLWCIKAAQHCHHAQSISQFTLTPFLWNELQGTGKYGVVPCLYTRLGGLWIWWRVWVLDFSSVLSDLMVDLQLTVPQRDLVQALYISVVSWDSRPIGTQ